MTDPNKPHRQFGKSEKILAFLKTHANVLISLAEISEATGLSRSDASSGLSHLRERAMLNIEAPMRGQYIYHSGPKAPIAPKTKVGDQLYEFVGATLGVTIIRDEQNELYVPVPLSEYLRMKGTS